VSIFDILLESYSALSYNYIDSIKKAVRRLYDDSQHIYPVPVQHRLHIFHIPYSTSIRLRPQQGNITTIYLNMQHWLMVLPLHEVLLVREVQQAQIAIHALLGLAVQWGSAMEILALWPVLRMHQHPWSAHVGYLSSPVQELASLMMMVLHKEHLSLSWLSLNFLIGNLLSDSVT
jgi:hypothetical protein